MSPYTLSASLFVFFVFIGHAESACPIEKDEPWSYNKKLMNGPEYWGETYANCYGKKQSPINIIKADVKSDPSLKKLQMINYDKPVTKFTMENNGHSVKVTPTDGVVRTLVLNGGNYNLDSFHFHWGDKYYTGSEHTINDQQYSMEMHLVHMDEKGFIAVVGVFYMNIFLMTNSGLSPIARSLKKVQYKGDKIELTDELRLNRLVDTSCSYYRYSGSLTTPGCDEGVTWTLCKEPKSLGVLQMQEFRKLYSTSKNDKEDISDCKIINNYRPLQPLNGRIVTSS